MAKNEAEQKESDVSRSQNANDEREQARQRFGGTEKYKQKQQKAQMQRPQGFC